MSEPIYIRELAEALNRRPHTIRCWERYGILPKRLHGKRSDRGWRYWTPEQVEEIKAWMVQVDLRPGKGLPHYQPDNHDMDSYLEKVRRPRGPRAIDYDAV